MRRLGEDRGPGRELAEVAEMRPHRIEDGLRPVGEVAPRGIGGGLGHHPGDVDQVLGLGAGEGGGQVGGAVAVEAVEPPLDLGEDAGLVR